MTAQPERRPFGIREPDTATSLMAHLRRAAAIKAEHPSRPDWANTAERTVKGVVVQAQARRRRPSGEICVQWYFDGARVSRAHLQRWLVSFGGLKP